MKAKEQEKKSMLESNKMGKLPRDVNTFDRHSRCIAEHIREKPMKCPRKVSDAPDEKKYDVQKKDNSL